MCSVFEHGSRHLEVVVMFVMDGASTHFGSGKIKIDTRDFTLNVTVLAKAVILDIATMATYSPLTGTLGPIIRLTNWFGQ